MALRNPVRLSRIRLRVRDARRSAVFYGELFGFREARAEANGRPRGQLLLRRSPAAGLPELLLSEGIGPGEYVAGMEQLGFEVASTEDVAGVYAEASRRGYSATQPRFYDGHWQTFLFDPDGYKVEVFTRAGPGADETPGLQT
jgi:catechol 2,3-dioxygenase-like lactoylglutathione lyase family enzyme